MEDLPWPPTNDVRWGPRQYPPFALPRRRDEPASLDERSHGGEFDLLKESAADIDAKTWRQLSAARQKVEQAINTARIEAGLAQGTQAFSDWMQSQGLEPARESAPQATSIRASLAHADFAHSAPTSARQQAPAPPLTARPHARTPRPPPWPPHKEDGTLSPPWQFVAAMDADVLSPALSPRPRTHVEPRPPSRTRVVQGVGTNEGERAFAGLRGIAHEAREDLQRLRAHSRHRTFDLLRTEARERAWWQWYVQGRERRKEIEIEEAAAEEQRAARARVVQQAREREAAEEAEHLAGRERQRRRKAEKERVEQLYAEQLRLGKVMAAQELHGGGKARRERPTARRGAAL